MRRVIHNDFGLSHEVEKAGWVFKKEGQIGINVFKEHAFLEIFQIARHMTLQLFKSFIVIGFALLLILQDVLKLFFNTLRSFFHPLLGENELFCRKDFKGWHLFDASLIFRMKGSDGINLIPKKLHTVWLGAVRWEDIQDAPPQCIFSFSLHKLHSYISSALKFFAHFFKIDLHPFFQGKMIGPEIFIGCILCSQRIDGGDNDFLLAVLQRFHDL